MGFGFEEGLLPGAVLGGLGDDFEVSFLDVFDQEFGVRDVEFEFVGVLQQKVRLARRNVEFEVVVHYLLLAISIHFPLSHLRRPEAVP